VHVAGGRAIRDLRGDAAGAEDCRGGDGGGAAGATVLENRGGSGERHVAALGREIGAFLGESRDFRGDFLDVVGLGKDAADRVLHDRVIGDDHRRADEEGADIGGVVLGLWNWERALGRGALAAGRQGT
jgi:hypothetical protein